MTPTARPSPATVAVFALVYLVVQVGLAIPGLLTHPSDFGTFYYPAARAILAGRSPYALPGVIVPPLFPLVLAPLALLPYAAARGAWFALSQLLAALAGIRVWRALGGDRWAAAAVAGAWATSGALLLDLREGQVNTVLLLLVVAVMWPTAKRPRLAPTALGVAIALKLWPGVLLVPEILRRRWAPVARACGVGVGLIVAPWLIVATLLSGPAAPTRTDFWGGSPGALNGSLSGIVLRALDPPAAGGPLPRSWVAAHSVGSFRMTGTQAAISVAVAIALFSAGVAAVARWSGTGAGSPPLASVAVVALTLVAAPVVWPHYHVLQLPGVALLAARFLRRRSWARLGFLGAMALASTWGAPLLSGPYVAHYGVTAASPLLLWALTSITPVGAVGILVLCLSELRGDSKGAEGSPPVAG